MQPPAKSAFSTTLKIKFSDHAGFIAFEKRTGQRTHKVSVDQLGLVEVLSTYLNMPLWVVHRLDKDTSGLILFAKSAEMASELSQLFEKHLVQKTYLFLTDRNLKKTEFSVESHIDKVENQFVNVNDKLSNSKTVFKFVKAISESMFLWQAQPVTGKPHQIRLHALKAGIPILGDTEHEGSAFFRLALHAYKLEFEFQNKPYSIETELPFCFSNEVSSLGPFIENEWVSLQKQIELEPLQTYRIYHRQTHENQLRIDLYGEVLWVYWYREEPPTENDLITLNTFCHKHNLKYVIRHMHNRGQGVGGLQKKDLYYSDAPEKWTAYENSISVELRRDQGFSPGLFLDQRANRHWILLNSENKKVLNLFSYTSVFSVAAALGKATQVTTVDASPVFLNWSKDNFKLNQLNIEKHDFFAQDSLLFLKGSKKRNRKWDLIICDPPSFGRTKTTTWKIEKDLPELIQLMESCLAPHGLILFTCNFEKWSVLELKKVFQKALPRRKFKILDLPTSDLDFEFPDAYNNLLKGLLLQTL